MKLHTQVLMASALIALSAMEIFIHDELTGALVVRAMETTPAIVTVDCPSNGSSLGSGLRIL